jgi:OmpA-OmpF porin, OOP family
MNMNTKKSQFFAIAAIAFSLLTLPARAETEKTNVTGSVTEPTGETYVKPKSLTPGVARLTIYRALYGYGSGAARMVINGHYLTSLQIGSYSDVCFKPTSAYVQSRFVATGEPVKNYDDATKTLNLKADQTIYLRVTDLGNGRVSMGTVSEDIAKEELVQTRRQIHAIARIPDAVPCEAKGAKPENKGEVISLNADALFAFGQSGLNAVSEQGKDQLVHLAERLKKQYGELDQQQLMIVGHADPLGNEQQNQALSLERAETIRQYLISHGIDAKKITSEGRGSKQPLVTTCSKVATQESIACNKPNRRVDVTVVVKAK